MSKPSNKNYSHLENSSCLLYGVNEFRDSLFSVLTRLNLIYFKIFLRVTDLIIETNRLVDDYIPPN